MTSLLLYMSDWLGWLAPIHPRWLRIIGDITFRRAGPGICLANPGSSGAGQERERVDVGVAITAYFDIHNL
jgi:hypothetical protein